MGSDRRTPAPILVVDDEALVRRCIVRELRGALAPVVEACSGVEALAALRSHRRLLAVVTDLDPGHGPDGLAVLRQARRSHPGAVRILLSGRVDAAEVSPVVDGGLVSRFLQKPWSPPELCAGIVAARAVLGGRARHLAPAMCRILEQSGQVRELVSCAREGDDDAVVELLRRHRGLLESIARGRHGLDEAEASAAYRGVASRLVRDLPRIGSIRTYLASATHAACLRRARRDAPGRRPRPVGDAADIEAVLGIDMDPRCAELLGAIVPASPGRPGRAAHTRRPRPAVVHWIEMLRQLS